MSPYTDQGSRSTPRTADSVILTVLEAAMFLEQCVSRLRQASSHTLDPTQAKDLRELAESLRGFVVEVELAADGSTF